METIEYQTQREYEFLDDTHVKVRLRGWATVEEVVQDKGEFYASVLYGELVKRAIPFLRRYHSDLWHDARHLREMVAKGECKFFYTVRERGTHLWKDRVYGDKSMGHVRVWNVEVKCEDGTWWAYFTRLPEYEMEG